MKPEHPNHLDRITRDPKIMVGKPVVRGTRIPVERVLAHLEENDRADLFEAFPELTDADARACLAYARAAIVRQRRLDRLSHALTHYNDHLDQFLVVIRPSVRIGRLS